MNRFAQRLLFWMPRILGLVYIAFVGLMALDVFSPEYTFWQALAGLAIHLIPAALLATALALSWRRAWLGGVLFLALGALALVVFRQGHWSAYVVVSGPPLLMGALFWLDWWRVRRQQA